VSPTLSVVVPAFRNASTIEETMRSILDQQGVDFELVVADHTSPDGTAKVLERFHDDPRVRLLTTPAGGGAPRNWNRVTAEATGTYVKLVCGDDVLRPGVLQRQVELLESSGAVLTACRRDIIDAHGATLRAGWGLRSLAHGSRTGADAVRTTVRAGTNLLGEPASTMMRRDALVETGLWFADFPYLIDLATYARVLMRGDFVPDDTVGATFRMTAGQWSVALTRDQARQARGFHRWFADTYPGVLSRADLAEGDAKATAMAYARRASYWVLKRRMR
jgi:glycosyltransferase involved in cell wall biosynthesis